MTHGLRPRSRASRAFWIALLLLAFVWAPALQAASKLHESEHLVQRDHVHVSDHDSHGKRLDAAAVPDATDPWHALMHLNHCCGHSPALPTQALLVLDGPRRALRPRAQQAATHDAALTRPLRPPIAG